MGDDEAGHGARDFTPWREIPHASGISHEAREAAAARSSGQAAHIRRQGAPTSARADREARQYRIGTAARWAFLVGTISTMGREQSGHRHEYADSRRRSAPAVGLDAAAGAARHAGARSLINCCITAEARVRAGAGTQVL